MNNQVVFFLYMIALVSYLIIACTHWSTFSPLLYSALVMHKLMVHKPHRPRHLSIYTPTLTTHHTCHTPIHRHTDTQTTPQTHHTHTLHYTHHTHTALHTSHTQVTHTPCTHHPTYKHPTHLHTSHTLHTHTSHCTHIHTLTNHHAIQLWEGCSSATLTTWKKVKITVESETSQVQKDMCHTISQTEFKKLISQEPEKSSSFHIFGTRKQWGAEV